MKVRKEGREDNGREGKKKDRKGREKFGKGKVDEEILEILQYQKKRRGKYTSWELLVSISGLEFGPVSDQSPLDKEN